MKKPNKKQRVIPEWAVKAKALMKAKRITQQDIADRLGMERATVSHYLNGYRDPGVETVVRMAEILGVFTSQLVGEIPLAPESADTRRILQLWMSVGAERQEALLQMWEAGTRLALPRPPENE